MARVRVTRMTGLLITPSHTSAHATGPKIDRTVEWTDRSKEKTTHRTGPDVVQTFLDKRYPVCTGVD